MSGFWRGLGGGGVFSVGVQLGHFLGGEGFLALLKALASCSLEGRSEGGGGL